MPHEPTLAELLAMAKQLNARMTALEKKVQAVTEPQPPPRTLPEVMLDWQTSPTPRRRRIADAYWDAFESGRPLSEDDR